jgi:cytochrome b subunit of formate dehydrogenase
LRGFGSKARPFQNERKEKGLEDSIPVKGPNRMEKEKKEEISLKTWIWMAVIDIVAIVITGLLIFSRH